MSTINQLLFAFMITLIEERVDFGIVFETDYHISGLPVKVISDKFTAPENAPSAKPDIASVISIAVTEG